VRCLPNREELVAAEKQGRTEGCIVNGLTLLGLIGMAWIAFLVLFSPLIGRVCGFNDRQERRR
jgi:hypothetical protein